MAKFEAKLVGDAPDTSGVMIFGRKALKEAEREQMFLPKSDQP